MAQGQRCNNFLETGLLTPNARANLLIIPHHLSNLFLILISKLHLILNRNPLKNHLILCQRPRLIRQNIPNPAQLLGYRRISRYTPLDQLIIVDIIRIKQFGKVQIDPHGDGDD